MPDSSTGTDLLERVVRLETRQEHQGDTMQSLSDRMDTLQNTMNDGFKALIQQVRRMNDWRTWAAFGVVVGATAVGNSVWHLILALVK